MGEQGNFFFFSMCFIFDLFVFDPQLDFTPEKACLIKRTC